MPQHKLPTDTKVPARSFPESNWFERLDTERGIPFRQTSSPDKDGVKGAISPHQLFIFFTYEVILEKKIFVR
jgi:hypothetical protein